METHEEEKREETGGNGWSAEEFAAAWPDAEELDRRVRELVRERPILAVAAAVAAGFVLGRLMTRV